MRNLTIYGLHKNEIYTKHIHTVHTRWAWTYCSMSNENIVYKWYERISFWFPINTFLLFLFLLFSLCLIFDEIFLTTFCTISITLLFYSLFRHTHCKENSQNTNISILRQINSKKFNKIFDAAFIQYENIIIDKCN